MRILVTGGAGFIASHLTDHLLAAGHEVAILDNLSAGRRTYVNAAAHFVEGDIRDEALVGTLFEARKIECLMHFAAQVSVRESVDDPVNDASVNIGGTITLLQAAAATGVRRCFLTATGGAVYGEQEDLPSPETAFEAPSSPYGITKLIAEHYFKIFGELHGMGWHILRLANVYGPRQDPHGEAGVVAIFAAAALDGRQATINGDGKQTRDFIYVADVCRAALALLAHPTDGIYNVGAGRETDIVEIHRLINDATRTSIAAIHGPAKDGEQRRSAISPRRLEDLTGWKPQVDLADGIRETVAFFRKEGRQ